METGSIANSDKSIARAFLNGYEPNPDTKALQFQVEVKQVLSSSITVAVMTGALTNVKSVQFSYLVFSPSQVSFVSYGGYISKSGFSGSGYQSIAGEIQSSNFVLAGLVRISAFSSVALTTSLDSDFVFGFKQDGSAVDFVYSYVVFGVQPSAVCASCDTEKLALDDNCLSACPTGTYTFTYKDGTQGCRRCSSKLNLVINSVNNGCVCAVGYQMQNSTCVAVGPLNSLSSSGDFASMGVGQGSSGASSISQIPNKVTVITNASAIISIGPNNGGASIGPTITVVNPQKPIVIPPTTGGGAIIIPTKPVDPNANSYVPTIPSQNQPSIPVIPIIPVVPGGGSAESAVSAQSCAGYANTYWSGYRCSCRVGYKMDLTTGLCVRISFVPPTTPTNPSTNCRDFENYVYGQCVCIDGYTRNADNRCVANVVCNPNSYFQNGICVCNSGFSKVGDRCVANNNCFDNGYFNGVMCVCNTGYVLDSTNTRCVLSNSCPPYSELRNGVCVCVAGYKEIRAGVCAQCDNGAVIIGGTCVFTCGVNQ